MEDKNSKMNPRLERERMDRLMRFLEQAKAAPEIDNDDEDTPTPSESKIKPAPSVAQVVEVLNSHEYEAIDEDATDWLVCGKKYRNCRSNLIYTYNIIKQYRPKVPFCTKRRISTLNRCKSLYYQKHLLSLRYETD